MTVEYVVYFRFVDDVMFSHNGVGVIDVGTVLKQVVKISKVFARGPHAA